MFRFPVRSTGVALVVTVASLSVACTEDVGVEDPVVAQVAVSPELDTLNAVGATLQLTAQPRSSDGAAISGLAVTWSSSDDGVATVASTGLATAVDEGSATVSAATGGVSGSALLVVELPSPAGTPPLAFRREDLASGDDWLYVLDIDAGTDSLLVGSSVGRYSMAPDLTRLVFNDESLDAWSILDLGSGTSTVVFDGAATGSPENASWSPDATRIAFEDGDVIFVVDVATLAVDTLDPILPPPFDPPGSSPFSWVSWSPDGSEIALQCSDATLTDRTICVVDLATDSVRAVVPPAAKPRSWPSWAPDGTWIAFGISGESDPLTGAPISGDEIRVVRPDGSAEQAVYVADITLYEEVRRPSWSPDSNKIAFECHDFDGNVNICILDVATGDVSESVPGEMPKWAN